MDKTQKLAEEALAVKKAWILAMAWIGKHPGDEWLTPPNYAHWPNKEIKRELGKLESDFGDLLKLILADWRGVQMKRIARWFAGKLDEMNQSRNPVFCLGRVQEVQRELGRLRSERPMEFPPYAEVLLQGFRGMAVRHPEYHLARDLVLQYNLFRDAVKACEDSLKQKRPISSEAEQSLARSVIITCYNLLESFVSGLVVAWTMENRRPVEEIINHVPRKERSSLKDRFVHIPALILNKSNLLDGSKPPFQLLFGDLKRRRDSFVHCEPGALPNKFGHVKEHAFHDVNPAVVEQTVDLTLEAISRVWKELHGREKPHWLPSRGENGRFENVEFHLTMKPTPSTPRAT